MSYAIKVGEAWVEITGPVRVPLTLSVERVVDGEPQLVEETDLVEVTPFWLQGLTEEERAGHGFVEVVETDGPAFGKSVLDVGGVPTRTWPDGGDLAEVKAKALSELAARRWEATQYFTYDGVRTQADRAVPVVNGRLTLRTEANIPAEVEMGFKLGDGEFRQWDRAAEVAFGIAIATHIQGCFDAEGQATAQIAAAETAEAVAAALASVTFPG